MERQPGCYLKLLVGEQRSLKFLIRRIRIMLWDGYERLLKKSLEYAASSFSPHLVILAKAGIQFIAHRQPNVLIFWIPGFALRPRNDDPVMLPYF